MKKYENYVKILFRCICSASLKSIRVNVFARSVKITYRATGGERFHTSIKTLIILEVGERGSSWSTGRQRGCKRETTTGEEGRGLRGGIEEPRDVGR